MASLVVEDMLRTYPADLGDVDRQKLAHCIEECAACAQACGACADACLSETGHLDMLAKCIRTNMDCADVCQATGSVLSRHTSYDANLTRAVLRACVVACATCADECERHASRHEHCRVCADACHRCRQACDDLLGALG
ncbi:four-helix bundle copper-binding protein [Streptomyces fradiae]|uniref:four-helix bundle copper-binding protein n=1 Tax=Streptomyces fradiae TaxID=1906 RepID=UPI003408842D